MFACVSSHASVGLILKANHDLKAGSCWLWRWAGSCHSRRAEPGLQRLQQPHLQSVTWTSVDLVVGLPNLILPKKWAANLLIAQDSFWCSGKSRALYYMQDFGLPGNFGGNTVWRWLTFYRGNLTHCGDLCCEPNLLRSSWGVLQERVSAQVLQVREWNLKLGSSSYSVSESLLFTACFKSNIESLLGEEVLYVQPVKP